MSRIISCRFIEDDVVDDFEAGQMTCWRILGLQVPEVNLFLDHGLDAISHDVPPSEVRIDRQRRLSNSAKVNIR